MGKAMRDARESDICVVGEDFLDAVKTPGDVSITEMLKLHSICSWGAEVGPLPPSSSSSRVAH